jgi:predicted ABC-type ATPase
MSILSGCPKEDVSSEEIRHFFEKSVENKMPADENKYAILMVGLPGSGKTTARTKCVPEDVELSNFVVIDVDIVLDTFFDNDITCYSQAYRIFNDWIDFCLTGNYNTIFEGTGKDLDQRIQDLYGLSYKVIICINLVKIKTAKQRVIKREKITGRKVREEYIEQVAKLLKDKIPTYITNNQIHDIHMLVNEDTLTEICKGKACEGKIHELHNYFDESHSGGTKRKRLYTNKNKTKLYRKRRFKSSVLSIDPFLWEKSKKMMFRRRTK